MNDPTEDTTAAPEAERDEAPLICLRGRAVEVPIRSLNGSEGQERVGIIFDANVMADIEQRFDDGYRGFVRYDADELAEDEKTVLHAEGNKVLDENGAPKREHYFGLEAWQASMSDRPFFTIRMTLAIALGITDREAGAAILEDKLADYFTALGAAYAIANGVDPTQALDAATSSMQAMRDELASQAAAAVDARRAREENETAATPGPPGSEPGDVPGEVSTSSGS